MLRRKTKPYGRCYVDDVTNAEYPSVTSILNVLQKNLDYWKMNTMGDAIIAKLKEAFEGKRLLDLEAIVKESKKAPNDYRDLKGNRGTFVHNVIEKRLNGEDITEPRGKDPKLSALMFQLDKWLENTKTEPVLVEAFLYSEKHGYAGTVDLVAYQTRNGHDKDLALIDFKTSKNLYSPAIWQLAAYCQAYSELYNKTPSIAYIMHLDYDRCIISEAMHIHKEEIEIEIQKFLHIFEAFKAMNEKHLQESS